MSLNIDKSMRHKRYDGARMCTIYTMSNNFFSLSAYIKRWFRTQCLELLYLLYIQTDYILRLAEHIHRIYQMYIVWYTLYYEITQICIRAFQTVVQGFETLLFCRQRERKKQQHVCNSNPDTLKNTFRSEKRTHVNLKYQVPM